MRVKKVNRYYCDFCKKAGCSSFHMKRHEEHCTLNPNRKCRMCKAAGYSPENISDLIKILPDPNQFIVHHSNENGEYDTEEGLEEAANATLDDLYEKTSGCPACMMAAFRQAHIPIPVVSKFDYVATCKEFWDNVHNENQRDYY